MVGVEFGKELAGFDQTLDERIGGVDEVSLVLVAEEEAGRIGGGGGGAMRGERGQLGCGEKCV